MVVIRILLAVLLAAATALASDDDCLRCHGELADAAASDAPKVNRDVLERSVHSGLGCNECHNVNSKLKHAGNRDVLCGRCHIDAAESYAKSPHVEGRAVSIEDIPTCVTCHGGHNILAVADPEAPTNHKNSVSICIKCHEDEDIKAKFEVLPEPQMIRAYESSVHGKALMIDGNMDAPACVDCHGSH
jgi:hypothetical protein